MSKGEKRVFDRNRIATVVVVVAVVMVIYCKRIKNFKCALRTFLLLLLSRGYTANK